MVSGVPCERLLPHQTNGHAVLRRAKAGIAGQVGAQGHGLAPLPAPAKAKSPRIMVSNQVGILRQRQGGRAGQMIVETQLFGAQGEQMPAQLPLRLHRDPLILTFDIGTASLVLDQPVGIDLQPFQPQPQRLPLIELPAEQCMNAGQHGITAEADIRRRGAVQTAVAVPSL